MAAKHALKSRNLTCITGYLSSSFPITICVATSGCHAIDLQCNIADVSPTLMIGSLFLKSHTTTLPDGDDDAIMCCTCLFQWMQLMLSSGVVFAPGVRGLSGFFKSQMYISESFAPAEKIKGPNTI